MNIMKSTSFSTKQLRRAVLNDLNASDNSVKFIRRRQNAKTPKLNKQKSKKKLWDNSSIKNSQLIAQERESRSKNKAHESEKSEKSCSLKKNQMQSYCNKIRKNNKKFISRENSQENLRTRLPWGVNGPKLTNYVLQTMEKMYKMRNNDKKQQTLHTQRSQDQMKQSNVKSEFTPKRSVDQLEKQKKIETKYQVIKSPGYQEKTDKKTKSRSRSKRVSSQQRLTEKQKKKKQSTQEESNFKSKGRKLPELILESFSGQFQCLEKNNLFTINYRIVKRKIIEVEVAIFKKVQNLMVNLIKGSLDCQSINETYENIMPKSSIILMSAVSGIKKQDKFSYPELQLILNEKNGTFGVQKKVIIPFSWIYLIQILTPTQLKQTKLAGKIKNKSIIEQIFYRRDILLGLQKIFDNNFIKSTSKPKEQNYIFGFKYLGKITLIKLVVLNNLCSLQCESSIGGNTIETLEMLQMLLQL